MSGLEGEANVRRRIQAVVEAPAEDLRELLAIAELDPAKHLRFQEWSGSSLRGNDLRGMDFTGARLLSVDFSGALIEGARFDKAIIAHAGLTSGTQTNLRAAADWAEFAAGWRKAPSPPSDRHLYNGAVFQDAPFAPEMVAVPPGRFWMGSKDGEGYKDEHPRHEVTIPHAIAVGRYPVTFKEWDFAQGDEEWEAITGLKPHLPDDRGWGRDRRPVIDVSWEDAQAYVKWLAHKTDQPYRLLSEAEWEYACRAGSEAAYCYGDSEAELRDYAWYRGNSGSHPVGEKKPNGFGLYDMHGNVWEWCLDGRRDYGAEPDSDPVGPLDGASRALRGGSWNDGAGYVRAAARYAGDRGFRVSFIGFRCARVRQ
jgi:formylglycine-generating enzyme required for sulfatase activity